MYLESRPSLLRAFSHPDKGTLRPKTRKLLTRVALIFIITGFLSGCISENDSIGPQLSNGKGEEASEQAIQDIQVVLSATVEEGEGILSAIEREAMDQNIDLLRQYGIRVINSDGEIKLATNKLATSFANKDSQFLEKLFEVDPGDTVEVIPTDQLRASLESGDGSSALAVFARQVNPNTGHYIVHITGGDLGGNDFSLHQSGFMDDKTLTATAWLANQNVQKEFSNDNSFDPWLDAYLAAMEQNK